MQRPNNLWDVFSQTADYASEAIPAYQREKRQMAEGERETGLRAAQFDQNQSRYAKGLNETRRHNLETERISAARHLAENPSFEKVLLDMAQNPNKYRPDQIKDFKEAADEFYNMKRPEPQPKEWQQPPDIVSEAKAGLTAEIKDWRTSNTLRPIGQQDEYPYKTKYGRDPNASSVQPTLTNSGIQDVPSQLDLARSKAEFHRLPADSVEWRLTGQPTGRFGLRPPPRTSFAPTPQPAAQPSYQGQSLGGLRSFNQPQQQPTGNTGGLDLESRGRQEFGDWDELTPQEKQAIARQEGWIQ